MYNHKKAQQSKNRLHISWDILYASPGHHLNQRCSLVNHTLQGTYFYENLYRNKHIFIGEITLKATVCTFAALWNTGTMCKDRRFYRHLWIRYIRVRNKIMYVLSWHISRYFTGWGHDMPNVVIGRASGQWQIVRFLMMTSWYGNALSGEMMDHHCIPVTNGK